MSKQNDFAEFDLAIEQMYLATKQISKVLGDAKTYIEQLKKRDNISLHMEQQESMNNMNNEIGMLYTALNEKSNDVRRLEIRHKKTKGQLAYYKGRYNKLTKGTK